MNKTQWITIFLAAVLFSVLYFGFDTSPKGQKAVEKKRGLSVLSTDVDKLVSEAKKSLGPQQTAEINLLETDLAAANSDSVKVELLKQISSNWYKFEKTAIAGHYAEKVAKILNDEEAWSIAGTTYSICVQREKEEKVKAFCTERAISTLEIATSLDPEDIQHKINLALVYTENPPKENPMKGILMLVELNKQNPDNVPVLTQLGRLAIKTGQYEKAIERLGMAVELEPTNRAATCLLGKAYESLGDQENSRLFQQKCEELSKR